MLRIDYIDSSVFMDDRLFGKYYDTIPFSMKKKIDAMHGERARRNALASSMLISYAAERKGISNDLSELTTNDFGKPYFVSGNRRSVFSISHSEDMVICFYSDDDNAIIKDLGCDIEKIRDRDITIAERFFSEKEYNDIMLAPDKKEKNDLFLRYWTLKESYIKALGKGLFIPLDSFCVNIGENGISMEGNEDFCLLGEENGIQGYHVSWCMITEEMIDGCISLTPFLSELVPV